MSRLLVGVSGWDYRDWRGPLYPTHPPRDFRALPLLARFLDFMEVNVTFYRPPPAGAAERWLQETPPRFTFLLKAFRGWTHDGQAPTGPDLAAFRAALEPMAAARRLEGVLVQLPPGQRADATGRRRLLELQAALPEALLFVEVRHRALITRDFLQFLSDHGLAFVNVDLPEVGTLPGRTSINTTPVSFLRLHGRNQRGWSQARTPRDVRYDHAYTSTEMEQLVAVVERLLSRSPRVLVGANNHFQAHAPAAAVLLKSLVGGQAVPAPPSLIASHPELRAHTVPLDMAESPPLHPVDLPPGTRRET